MHNLGPSTFNNMFSLVSYIHSYNTRADQGQHLFLKHAKTNLKKFSESVRGPTI